MRRARRVDPRELVAAPVRRRCRVARPAGSPRPQLIPDERAFALESDGLRLEGMLHEGDGAIAAVVLHPHPLYGGDMDSHVVLALRTAFAEAGATTLRFNFRGTGRSQGAYDDGRGEANDARVAIAAIRELQPGRSILLAGYSFGAHVAANVASTEPNLSVWCWCHFR